MNKTSEALSDAKDAIRFDSTYVKAYYRLAMAYVQDNNYNDAREALVNGLKLKGDDKELLTQLQRVEDRISSGAANVSVPRATSRVTVNHSKSSTEPINTSTIPSSSSASSRSTTTSTASQPATNSTKTVSKNEEDEEDPEIKKLNLRGYKKTADGRTTTFFNNELDEETKKLIGNIAPKKLENTDGKEVITTNVAVNQGVSAWNAAGTYEEKILTPWVKEYLNQTFAADSVIIDLGAADVNKLGISSTTGAVLRVTGIEEVTGDAQVTMLRGKKKHVCDFCFNVMWEISSASNKIKGSAGVRDVTADREYEIPSETIIVSHFNETAVNGQLGNVSNKDLVNLFQQLVKKSNSRLQQEIEKKLNTFWDDLKAK